MSTNNANGVSNQTTDKNVKAAIAKAVSSQGSFNVAVHEAARLTMLFAFERNGAGLEHAASLLNRLTNASKPQVAVQRWMESFFPVTVSKGEGGVLVVKARKGRTEADWQFEDANNTPWFKLEATKPAPVLLTVEIVLAKLAKLSKNASKQLADAPNADLAQLVRDLERFVEHRLPTEEKAAA